MKISHFNSTIFLDKKLCVIYNAYSDRYLITKKANANDKLQDVDSLKTIDSKFYENLVDIGYLIEDNIDELKLVKEIQNKVDNNDTNYNLIINPTLDCNFNCWYCYETHVSNSSLSNEVIKNIKNFIFNVVNRSTLLTFHLSFFGGEPFIQFKTVREIIEYTSKQCKLYNKKFTLSFTTNGFLLDDKKISYLSNYNTSMQITLDGYKTDHDRTRYTRNGSSGSYDRIIQNIKKLIDQKISVILRINYTEKNINESHNIITDLYSINTVNRNLLNIDFHRVWQDSDKENISETTNHIIDLFSENGFNAYKYPLNNVRSSCYADKVNQALINYNGDVFKCTALNFTKTVRDGYLDANGEIVWENNSFQIRKNIKFNNKPCLECRILPICNGGCSQKAVDFSGSSYCVFGFSDVKKDDQILDRLRYIIKSESKLI